jgi:hypothetical protein
LHGTIVREIGVIPKSIPIHFTGPHRPEMADRFASSDGGSADRYGHQPPGLDHYGLSFLQGGPLPSGFAAATGGQAG